MIGRAYTTKGIGLEHEYDHDDTQLTIFKHGIHISIMLNKRKRASVRHIRTLIVEVLI